MIQVQKEKDNILISITAKLDREDVVELMKDLNKWLSDKKTESNIKFHNAAHQEAFEQAQSKRKMEEDMKEYIASIPKTQHIQKEVQTIELDALNREVEITKIKLKENGRK